jgi:hypothetical protein
MAMIDTIQIATNRYAPEGSDAINMYATSASGPLTLGQVVQAACLRSAAALEAQSVLKMNKMTEGSVLLDEAADWLGPIADGSADWPTAKTFLVGKMGIDASTLPADLTSYDRRMQAAAALKNKMDPLIQTQQEAMVDLQSIVNRRDVAHSTASNIVRALANSAIADAANFA